MRRVGVCMVVLVLVSWARADYIVVGYQNSELLQYDDNGGYVGKFTGDGAVASGTSISSDAEGRVYYGNVSGVISRFDQSGSWDHWYQQQSYGQIYGMVAKSDAVFVSDAPNNTVTMYDPSQSAGGGVSLNAGSYSISNPQGMCQDAAGRIYVANRGDGSVLRWNADGTFDTQVIAASGAPNCNSLAVDADGYLWVLRVEARQLAYLVRFNQDGSYAGLYRTLDASTGIEYANNVFISPTGQTMISASTGIHAYNSSNDTWSTFVDVGSGGLSAPYGITYVPEPATLALLCLGGLLLRRKRTC